MIASSALAPDWHYVGTRAVNARVYVYRRNRTVPVRLPTGEDTVSVVNQVALPIIDRGRIQLEPDGQSTMRFGGPKRLLRATSPNAEAERFADEVAYTIPLGDLVRSDRDPRVLVGDPTPPDKSFTEVLADRASRATAQVFEWITSLIGLIIGAAVTAVVGSFAVREWNKRHGAVAPQPLDPNAGPAPIGEATTRRRKRKARSARGTARRHRER
jgi:hypothetical protein